MNRRLLLDLDGVTVRIWDRLILPDTHWQVLEGQQWAVLGPNASGKSALVRAIMGQLPCAAGRIRRNVGREGWDGLGYVSFELHRQLMERDRSRDLSRFASGHETDFTTAGQTILEGAAEADAGRLRHVVQRLGIEGLVERPMRVLSNGETRKVLIARALLRRPELLILDEPFDGLDETARGRLEAMLGTLIAHGVHLILVTHRTEEIIPPITHVLCLKDGKVFCQGERARVLSAERVRELYGVDGPAGAAGPSVEAPDAEPSVEAPDAGPSVEAPAAERSGRTPEAEPLVELNNVVVRYGQTVALRSLSWTMRRGEHWAVLGPNGSGKTTLISLIYADNVQAYTNDIRLFGRRRGSGESIWEIKRRIGHVSPHLQVSYRLDLKVFEVVVSGFFDSVGLYRRPTEAQREAAWEWIRRLGVESLSGRDFGQLSYGERRLVIIVRALVKSPEILALDEPCQGLDPANRARVLAMIDRIGLETPTAILYVTHRKDEMPRCITHTLRLSPAS